MRRLLNLTLSCSQQLKASSLQPRVHADCRLIELNVQGIVSLIVVGVAHAEQGVH